MRFFFLAATALLLGGCATPMQKAILNDDLAEVKTLLAAGVGVNERLIPPYIHTTVKAPTPLHFAAMLGEDDIVRFLLGAGADINAIDSTDRTPFEQAVAMRNPGTAKILKEWEIQHSTQAATAALAAAASAASGIVTRDEVARMVAEALAARSRARQPAEFHSDSDAPAYKLAENPDNFALVIGVEKYMSLPDATFARRDAEAVRDHLLALGYPPRNVILLTDSRATKTNWAKYIEAWLPENVNERSTVFVFYSGHGAPDVATGQAYLVPVEGDPQYLAVSALPLEQLYSRLGALKAKRVIVALDSCFSGAGGRSVLPRGTRPLISKLDTGRIDPRGKIIALTASAADEISGTIDAQGHGAFTYFLLKGLNGAAADKAGTTTIRGLFDYLKPNVADVARQQNRDQTPALLPADSEMAAIRIR
jgi:hypothetical protein